MEDIPISFECEGKKYAGYFSQVMGQGSNSNFHLYINKYFCGTLKYTDKWVFYPTPKTEQFVPLADDFGRVVMAAAG